MTKRVIVIASGETERRVLPHLVAHLQEQDVVITDVRIPARNRPLNVPMAEKLIKAAWYENLHEQTQKFVVVVDVDAKEPQQVLAPFQEKLPGRIQDVEADVLFAFAQRHLEAWYFADADNLKAHLKKSLGKVDTSNPDQIQNPKTHLRNLLGRRLYTAIVSEEIASQLDAPTIAQRSPSFRGFLNAAMNGGSGNG